MAYKKPMHTILSKNELLGKTEGSLFCFIYNTCDSDLGYCPVKYVVDPEPDN